MIERSHYKLLNKINDCSKALISAEELLSRTDDFRGAAKTRVRYVRKQLALMEEILRKELEAGSEGHD